MYRGTVAGDGYGKKKKRSAILLYVIANARLSFWGATNLDQGRQTAGS